MAHDGTDFFINFSEKTWNSKEQKERIEEFTKAYSGMYLPNFQYWSTMYSRAREHMGLYLGDQYSWGEIENKRLQRRNVLTFNHIFRTINTIAGHFDQSQLGYSVQAVSPDEVSNLTADILNDCLRRVCYNEDVYGKISSCVRESCIAGWSGLRVYMDYSVGGGGEIKVKKTDWSNLVIDPFTTQRDLSDCSYIATRSILPKAKLAAMYPKHADKIMFMKSNVTTNQHFPWTPHSRINVLDENHLHYTEMYRMVLRSAKHIFDPKTKELVRWDGSKEEFQRLRLVYPEAKIVDRPIQAIEFGILVENELVHFEENPYGCDCYPIQPFFAIFEPSYDIDKRVQSLVSIIADSQKAYNKRKNAILDILDTNLQSGVIYKEGTVLDPESLYMIRAGQNICIERDSAIQDSIQQISPVDIPASLFQATHDLETNINTLLGVNPEMFGQTQGGSEGPIEMSGVLYRMKQASAMVGMQPFFSSVREAQRLFGIKILKMIQAHYSPDKMRQISKKEPTLEIFNQEWAKFNIVVEEGLIENRNSNLEQKLALRQLGIPVSTRTILEDAPIYGKNEMIQFAEQQEAVQAQIQEIQLEKERQAIENLAQDLRSEASKNQAYALNTLSAIGLNAAQKEESLARSQKTKADTVEKFAEVLKRFSEVPPERLEMALNFMAQMTQGVEQSIDEKKQLVEQEADQAIAMHLPPQDLSLGESDLGIQSPVPPI